MARSEAGRRKPLRPMMLIILLWALASAGAGGWLLYSHYIPQGSREATAAPSETVPQESPTLFSPEPFLVNLADASGKRYLRVSFDIEVTSPLTAQELQKKMSQVRDTVLLILSNKHFDDIRTTAGKGRLREEILDEVNKSLITGRARKVYFKEFVVQ